MDVNGAPQPRKRGRPSKFTVKLAEKIYFLARMGLTDKQLSWVCDINEDTLNSWKKSPIFMVKLKKAKEHADEEIERALLTRARGMKVTDKIIERHSEADKDGNPKEGGKTKQTLVEREIPPDVPAMRLWLINRRPEKWKDRPVQITQDNRSLAINFNAIEIAGLIQDEYGERAKLLARAVRDAIGVTVEPNPPPH